MQALRKETAPNGRLSILPLDVLQKVASLMPLKDWAKASGACRLMHTLQLDVIHIADPRLGHLGLMSDEQQRSTGLKWASRRWRCATSLQLELAENSPRELAAALFSQQPEERPSCLIELSLNCRSTTAEDSALLPWLTTCTPQLSVLLCQAISVLMVPPLVQLKHLVLALFSPRFSHAAEALPQLRGLQTLSLECSDLITHTLPVLDLQALCNLRRVNLSHVAAKRLALPEGCRISVQMIKEDLTLMRDHDWASALPVLHSLHLAVRGAPLRPTVAELQACAWLRHLCLHTGGCLGEEGAPCRLGDGLDQLESVTLTAPVLCLAVPRGACWRVVSLHAYQKLSVAFEDVRAFAAAANVFCLVGPRDKSSGPAALGEALTALGKVWARSTLPGCGGQVTAMHSLKDWCAEKFAHTGQDDCMCGACMRCLHRAGVISVMPALQHPIDAHYLLPGLGAYAGGAPFGEGYYSDEYDEEYGEGYGEGYDEGAAFEDLYHGGYYEDDGPYEGADEYY